MPKAAAGVTVGTPTAACAAVLPGALDMSSQLDACFASLGPGSTWDGGALTYTANEGIAIDCAANGFLPCPSTPVRNVTIQNATFVDNATIPNLPGQAMNPIFAINREDAITVQNVNVVGINVTAGTKGRYQASEAGFRLLSADQISLLNVSSTDSWGDGLELTTNDSAARLDSSPVTGLLVYGFTSTNAGRDCITPGEVLDSLLDWVNCVQTGPARTEINFETDSAMAGSSNVTISHCSGARTINLIEYLYGPVTIEDCTGILAMHISDADGQTVTVANSTFACNNRAPNPCILQTGGTVWLPGDVIGRVPGETPTEPAVGVNGGGTMYVGPQTTWVGPEGSPDPGSTLVNY